MNLDRSFVGIVDHHDSRDVSASFASVVLENSSVKLVPLPPTAAGPIKDIISLKSPPSYTGTNTATSSLEVK